jgi:nitrogen fixation protein NifU and related proteins
MNETIYKEHILQHYKNPHNKHVLHSADMVGTEVNALCGDKITVYANIDTEDIITACSFTGEGCAISIAAASLLTDYARGRKITDIPTVTPQDMAALLGISFSTVRSRCAMLAAHAFQKCVKPDHIEKYYEHA